MAPIRCLLEMKTSRLTRTKSVEYAQADVIKKNSLQFAFALRSKQFHIFAKKQNFLSGFLDPINRTNTSKSPESFKVTARR